MRFRAAFLLLFAVCSLQLCPAQDAPPPPDSPPAQAPAPGLPPLAPVPSAPEPPPSASVPGSASGNPLPDRLVSWIKLGPNILHDQKDIWLFPVSVARGRHLLPTLILTGVTAGLIAGVDARSGRYFQRTQSFDGFNAALSGQNTSIAMFAVPGALYAISLARRDSYAQHTFLLAGEAVLDSEILTTVMKDATRRLKPSEVPMGGNFSDTWFRSHDNYYIQGAGSFPSGHTIAAFSVATVFADRYPKYRWVAYGLAALVGFTRVTEQAHFPSDVFAGAVLSYVIAHYAVERFP